MISSPSRWRWGCHMAVGTGGYGRGAGRAGGRGRPGGPGGSNRVSGACGACLGAKGYGPTFGMGRSPSWYAAGRPIRPGWAQRGARFDPAGRRLRSLPRRLAGSQPRSSQLAGANAAASHAAGLRGGMPIRWSSWGRWGCHMAVPPDGEGPHGGGRVRDRPAGGPSIPLPVSGALPEALPGLRPGPATCMAVGNAASVAGARHAGEREVEPAAGQLASPTFPLRVNGCSAPGTPAAGETLFRR